MTNGVTTKNAPIDILKANTKLKSDRQVKSNVLQINVNRNLFKKQPESLNTYSQEIGNSWMKSLAHILQINMFKYA